MRSEVTCSRCLANVLVVEHVDAAGLANHLLAAGWISTTAGAACTDCRFKPVSEWQRRPAVEPKPAKPVKKPPAKKGRK